MSRFLLGITFLIFGYGQCCCHALSSPPTPTPPEKASSSSSPPSWWTAAWNILPSPGAPRTPIQWGDVLFGIRTNLEHSWWLDENENENTPFLKVPVATTTDPAAMQSDFFPSLRQFRKEYGTVFKVDLGATQVTYVGDASVTKHVLLNSGAYDKGLVGLVGGDVFGDGLITALDRTVWSRRRRAVAPTMGANKNFLEGLLQDFVTCTKGTFDTLDQAAASSSNSTTTIDLEEACLAIALDALGVTVFGTNFDATRTIGQDGGDPLVRAVFRVLKETNIRAEKPLQLIASFVRPTWLAEWLSPDLKEYRDASRLLDTKINELIANLKTQEEKGDGTGSESTPSILRILVESRDGETTSQQVKDDLITLLIAGHETVASVLTWALYELARNPPELQEVQREIDTVLGNDDDVDTITMQDIMQLQCTRRALTEALRLYPAPPLLSRRALQDDVLPTSNGHRPPLKLQRGDNVFLLTAMLHRDPDIYGEDAEVFRPDRWAGPIQSSSQDIQWKGYEGPNPAALYPSEQATDFALVGFGAGEFKCVGDKFAFVEATIVLALLLKRYDFALVTEDVGFDMAGTIHTSNGLMAYVKRRDPGTYSSSVTGRVQNRQQQSLDQKE